MGNSSICQSSEIEYKGESKRTLMGPGSNIANQNSIKYCEDGLERYSRLSQEKQKDELTLLADSIKDTDWSCATFNDEFKMGTILGKGASAKVYLAVHRRTKVACAVKVIKNRN